MAQTDLKARLKESSALCYACLYAYYLPDRTRAGNACALRVQFASRTQLTCYALACSIARVRRLLSKVALSPRPSSSHQSCRGRYNAAALTFANSTLTVDFESIYLSTRVLEQRKSTGSQPKDNPSTSLSCDAGAEPSSQENPYQCYAQ